MLQRDQRQSRHYRVNTRCSRPVGGKDQKMPSGWTGGVHSSQRWKQSKHNGWSDRPTAMTADSSVIAVGPPITGRVRCVGGQRNIRTSVKSREISRDRSYKENRSPVFSYERSPSCKIIVTGQFSNTPDSLKLCSKVVLDVQKKVVVLLKLATCFIFCTLV